MFPYVQVGKVVFQCMKGQIQAQLTRNKVVSTSRGSALGLNILTSKSYSGTKNGIPSNLQRKAPFSSS